MATYQISSSRKKDKKTPAPAVSPAFRFTEELVLLVCAVLWGIVVLSLATHSVQDAAWSTAGIGRAGYVNRVGLLGAWLSDFLLYFFGYSAFWILAVSGFLWLRAVTYIFKKKGAATAIRWQGIVGFFVLLCASSALEWGRFYSYEVYLPGYSGGVLGHWLGILAEQLAGYSGATLLWIILLLVGMSLAFGFSWLRLAEKIGSLLEALLEKIRRKAESAKDGKIGLKAQQEREETVRQKREETSKRHAPAVVIEPVLDNVMPSQRVIEERQKPLFKDLNISALPEISLLDEPRQHHDEVTPETLEMTSQLIEKKLADFGVQVQVTTASPGPVITRYEFEPAVGVKGSQVVNLAKDLARSLGLVSLRVIETIPGKTTMALELPNAKRQTIHFSEVVGSSVYHESKSLLTLCLGKDIIGRPVVADLAKMPHVLVAGTTGSGKSVGINGMILSMLYKAEPSDVRLLMVDPKMLEMSVYEGIPHLLAPVVTDMKQAANALNWCVGEMEKRYRLMSKLGVRNLTGFNNRIEEAKSQEQSIPNPFSLTPENPEPLEKLPYIVVVIDELADLMMVVGKKIEELIARLAQKARAAGIHLILATQRPSVDVITGLIKANIPTRIAFQVSSKVDSRTILDQMGAEALLGMGDMLYLPPGSGMPVRVHGAFVSDREVHRVVEFLKEQGEPNYIEGVLEGGIADGEGASLDVFGSGGDAESDPLYDRAVAIVLKNRRASISLVQRHLKIGYNRAARILEQMENAGIVSAMSSNGNRDILVPAGNDEG